MMNAELFLSDIDEKRFGIKVAKVKDITSDYWSTVMRFCLTNKVALLIARCSTAEVTTIQAMEKKGFILTDTLVYYKKEIHNKAIPYNEGQVRIRPIRQGEENRIKEIAQGAFRGYYGHYHADERLNRLACNEVYIDWAFRSCLSKDMADMVLVAELGNSVVGFATLQIKSPDTGEGVLFGVAPEAQRHGVYRAMMIGGMIYLKEKGLKQMVVSTQIMNIAVQKVWTRLGFEPSHSYYTSHKWFVD